MYELDKVSFIYTCCIQMVVQHSETVKRQAGLSASLSALIIASFLLQQVKAIERFMRRLEFHHSKVCIHEQLIGFI